MTTNQIAYWQNVERERSNRANEQIAQYEADIKAAQQQETARHNIESEIATYMDALAKNDATVAGAALSRLSPQLQKSGIDISAFQDAAMSQAQQTWSHAQSQKDADIFNKIATGIGKLINPFFG